ncbi:TetR/AcrR family transcriptional regulator [Halorussus gelatinilyticus]|uniref:TetR/AcrR family transcriptional regulator n=1 Tax=Halorussus gelatinilyticus TaxID=2937524 RepID=A0A8U0IG69_9EURY|nr:TetR/AcrR family transcriptional regulator [Halorussus gelatinilyticus]UPV99048.1 TetR/AcrR family transcriptional regulator [Halorussus gelatinilyticus]
MRGFDADERERIRRRLRETGRDLFARYGLDKTTIADLTDPADIANGTFYRFYDSKEELYFEILREEGERLAADILAESFERVGAGEGDGESRDEDALSPEEGIVAFLTLLCEEIETNSLVRRLIVDDDLSRLMAQFSDDELREEQAQSLSYVVPYVERWQAEGHLREGDPEVLAAAMGVVKFVAYHKDDFHDEAFYRAVRNALIEVVAAGLTTDGA